MSEDLELRKFNIREADWQNDGPVLSNIRRLVFILEQKVPKEEEWDGRDDDSWHWLATLPSEAAEGEAGGADRSGDRPIGTARLLPDGQIGRMAVLADYRRYGVGAALLEQAVTKARHLGFPQVYLNAQTHALGFYERCGFTAEGEEFMEAGIPHRRMTRHLSPPVDNIQRRSAVDPDATFEVKPFDTAEVTWKEMAREIRRIRRRVFETELGLDTPPEDDADPDALHWIATNADGHIAGVVRMQPDGTIAQFAVVDDHRGHGVGSTLLELAVHRARRFSLPEVRINDVPPGGEAFLEHHAFRREGGAWVRTIEAEDREVQRRSDTGEAPGDDIAYRLGEDSQLILLRRESDFRNVILEMARQARQWIRIYSPVMTHALFDNNELMDICSALARRNKYTHVEMLVFDPHRMVKHGHALLSIARKLPSSIGIRVVDPEMRQQNHEYVLVDGEGVVYRQEHDTWEGTACFHDITECNRLNRQFTASWESGLLDPNLRQLRL